MEKILVCLIAVFLSIPVMSADLTARQMLDKASEFVASAPSLLRTDVGEKIVTLIKDGTREVQPVQKSEITIEIDLSAGSLARQTTVFDGKTLIMIRQGESTAMKLGDEPWQKPTGPFEVAAKDMGNLFICEKLVPETDNNAPKWIIAGTEMLGSIETVLIESEGNSAAPIAEERMALGIKKAYAANPAISTEVKVLEYKSKHWLGKSDFSRLKVAQNFKSLLTLTMEDKKQVIETVSNSVSTYFYGKVKIEIPIEAQSILKSK
ncbi:MAG: hypothetical protein PHW04_16395 [Candidatus Wallbacteria bacterium]|nr:hypothetical protein [Candidatus Wallbacteria bacterium]